MTASGTNPTRAFLRDYGAALEMCAADLSVGAGDLRIVRTDLHYKSTQIYVAPQGDPTAITHVIKTQPGRSPQQDFDGLRHAQQVFTRRDRLGPHRFGAIAPVGLRTVEPSFLVMRYQRGTPVRETFDAALLRLRQGPAYNRALEHCRGIAAWLAVLRSEAVKADGGLTPSAYLGFCRDRLLEIRGNLRLGRRLADLESRIERHVASLSNADRERLQRLYPRHGDLAPQNFLCGDSGELIGLDFGTFGFTPLNADYFHVRARLEHYALRRPWAPTRALTLWQAFSDTFTEAEGSRSFAFHAYVYALLANLALNTGRSTRGRMSLSSRLKMRLWIRQRLRWLAQLTGDLEADVRLLHSKL
jgi:aminoglycoside phosphotransferase (APT) family kinase protein